MSIKSKTESNSFHLKNNVKLDSFHLTAISQSQIYSKYGQDFWFEKQL